MNSRNIPAEIGSKRFETVRKDEWARCSRHKRCGEGDLEKSDFSALPRVSNMLRCKCVLWLLSVVLFSGFTYHSDQFSDFWTGFCCFTLDWRTTSNRLNSLLNVTENNAKLPESTLKIIHVIRFRQLLKYRKKKSLRSIYKV